MHTYGDAEDAAEGNQVGTDMSVSNGAVIGSPAVHDAIDILEAVLRGVEARNKPRGGPSGVGALIQYVVGFRVEFHRPPFSQLQYGAKACYAICAYHGHGHSALGDEVRTVTAATEIIAVGRHPTGGLKTCFHIGIGDIPRLLHRGLSVCCRHSTRSIEGSGTAINKMYETACGLLLRFLACHTFHSFGAPVGTDIREHHATVGEQVTEEHRQAVEEVVLRSQDISLAGAVPVEAGAEHRFREVEVRFVIGPLALTLHTAKEGIMTEGLFFVTHLLQARIAVHQVAYNHHGLDGKLPVGILLLAVLAFALTVEGSHGCAGEERTVLVVVVSFLRLAVFLNPSHRLLKLLGVEDIEIDTAQNLHQRNIFCTHSQIMLQEVGIHDGSGNTHTGVPQ